ncbi:MAG: BrnA antitoxin family protein [Edaphobacter sp.]
MNEKNIGIVRFKRDPKHPTKMTAKQMKRLREMKDEDIDLSDAPASPRDAVWTRPGALVPVGNKKQITVRLDADVLEFFRKTGSRYQSRINAALREYMKAHEKAS